MAGANLLEAEIVTADGAVRIANACTNPDLFWALKGGGAGFGVVTRVTLSARTTCPNLSAPCSRPSGRRPTIPTAASSQDPGLLSRGALQPELGRADRLRAGPRPLDRDALSRPGSRTGRDRLESALRLGGGRSAGLRRGPAPKVVAAPARRFWDPAALRQFPGVVIGDDRPGAPAENVFWAGNLGEAGVVWHAYQSAWLPAGLLEDDRRQDLGEALVAAARRGVGLHFNKGLAGASADAVAARETAPRIRRSPGRSPWPSPAPTSSPPIPEFRGMSRTWRRPSATPPK